MGTPVSPHLRDGRPVRGYWRVFSHDPRVGPNWNWWREERFEDVEEARKWRDEMRRRGFEAVLH